MHSYNDLCFLCYLIRLGSAINAFVLHAYYIFHCRSQSVLNISFPYHFSCSIQVSMADSEHYIDALVHMTAVRHDVIIVQQSATPQTSNSLISSPSDPRVQLYQSHGQLHFAGEQKNQPLPSAASLQVRVLKPAMRLGCDDPIQTSTT